MEKNLWEWIKNTPLSSAGRFDLECACLWRVGLSESDRWEQCYRNSLPSARASLGKDSKYGSILRAYAFLAQASQFVQACYRLGQCTCPLLSGTAAHGSTAGDGLLCWCWQGPTRLALCSLLSPFVLIFPSDYRTGTCTPWKTVHLGKLETNLKGEK